MELSSCNREALQLENSSPSFYIPPLLVFPLQAWGDIYTQLQRSIGASERLLDIMKEEDESESTEAAPMKLNGEIVFQDVQFSYPTRPDFTVLKGLNFTIKSGEKVALVGPSGSGKSTIINLLMRFLSTFEWRIKC